MSSGSISRRRVGSVSQNGRDSPLPPLDIQSIQMPSNPINALALKTASLSSTRSLYQICSHLRKRLRWVEGFARFLDQPESAGALDVVSHMVHLFRMGSPLCHLYNLLLPAFTAPGPLYSAAPAPSPIKFDYPDFMESHEGVRNWAKRPENAKMCQKYIAVFCMAMKQRREEGRWHEEMWALHELWGKSNGEDMEAYDTTGFLKVLQTVETMLDHLPESAISPTTPHTPSHMAGLSYDAATASSSIPPLPVAPAESVPDNAFKSVEELVNSEKSYVQELEILVRCSQEMVDAHIISTETSHQMFSNLSKILDFHRKFLIKLETEYEPVEESGTTAWAEGRWGRPFVTSEGEFDCYGPYCANYLDAIAIVGEYMPSMLRGQSLPDSERPCLHPERELQAFMIKPIQRITKYGLLLGAILSATAKHDYKHRAELEEGAETIRRVAANIDEATDFKAKQLKVRDLVERVEDWKGHVVEKFGDLYLDDHFTVTKADQPREYHVFLFEKMMLCCKEVTNKKVKTKTKRMSVDRRLALKGRIFVSNIHRATLGEPVGTGDPFGNKLTIAWTVPHRHPSGHAEELEDWFVMTGKHEDTLKKWGDKVMELAIADRKRQDDQRNSSHFSASMSHFSSSWAPPTPAAEAPPFAFPPPMPGDDEYDMSGRSTPMSQRRVQSQQMQTPYGHYQAAEMRTRALTEDQNGPSMMQWRQGHRHGSESASGIHMMPPPPMPRMQSAQSAMSAMSEASFGMGTPHSASGRSMLGRHPSSSRLGPAEEVDEEYAYGNPRGMARAPSYPHQPHSSASYGIPPSLRERSASSPNVYGNPSAPYASHNHYSSSSSLVAGVSGPGSASASMMNGQASASGSGGTAFFNKRMSGKRSSGESHSTETSDSSGPSPATPYSHTAAIPTPVSRQNSGDAQLNGMLGGMSLGNGSGSSTVGSGGGGGAGSLNTLLLRVKCGECHFSVSVPLDVTYPMLHQKIAKKVRLFRGSEPASMHIKWVDQDGDEVSLKCDQDVEGMFEEASEMGLPFVTLIAKVN